MGLQSLALNRRVCCRVAARRLAMARQMDHRNVIYHGFRVHLSIASDSYAGRLVIPYVDPVSFTARLRAHSSAVEHYLDMVGVRGSIPRAPTTIPAPGSS